MDIIAAHQQGLIEQLEDEVQALAGRARDHAQRAMVLHHLYDHSRGSHVWALAEARQSLWIASGIARLERRIARWGWTVPKRDQAAAALERLADALGEGAKAGMIAAYRSYRLSATKALRGEAEVNLPDALRDALDQCHHHRREGESLPANVSLVLIEESERLADAATDHEMLAEAWAMVETTGLRRAAKRLLGPKALSRRRARDERKGWVRIDGELRRDPALPAAFRANPAQHFYAMHRALAERRRQQWRELCDLEADSVALAA
jgi:hypothetical protein